MPEREGDQTALVFFGERSACVKSRGSFQKRKEKVLRHLKVVHPMRRIAVRPGQGQGSRKENQRTYRRESDAAESARPPE